MVEQQAESAESSPSLRIQGGTAARKAESETPREGQRPYGVSMQARTGKPVTMADLMEAEAYARRTPGQRSVHSNEDGRDDRHETEGRAEIVLEDRTAIRSDARAKDDVRTSSFRPMQAQNQFSASAGDVPSSQASLAGTNEETPTAPRSPFQLLRSLFSRKPGPGTNES